MLPQNNCTVNTTFLIRIKLREAMDLYRATTGQRLTYEDLAAACGLSVATLQSLGARHNYNTRLSTVTRLCVALQCTPGDLLELVKENRE
jgi:DNA-binding Xre family transcriptional regulator